MIWRADQKPMGYTDIVFCWLPKVISIHRSDDTGYNLAREFYIFWFVNVQRTVIGAIRSGIFVTYAYEYKPLGDL